MTIPWSGNTFGAASCGMVTAVIYNPDGGVTTPAVTPNGCMQEPTGRLGPVILPATGTYTLMLSVATAFGSANNGSMTFALNRVAAGDQTLTVGGPAVTVNLATGVQSPNVSFFGVAGERLSLKTDSWNPTAASCGALLAVRARDGSLLTNQAICPGQNPPYPPPTVLLPPLPSTGTYTVTISPYPSSVQSLTLQLLTSQGPTPTNTAGASPTPTTTRTPTPTGSPTRAGTATPLTGPAVSVRPSSVPQGGAVSAAWGGVPTPTANDWLGLYTVPGAGTPTPVAAVATLVVGAGTGQVSFPLVASTSPGTYELRLFRGSGTSSYQASSVPFGVTAATVTPTPSTAVSLIARPARVPAGGVLSAAWSGLVGPSASDWIGLYVPGTPPGSTPITAVNTNGQADGDEIMVVPTTLAPGTYELRLYKGTGTSSFQASSNLITVTTPGTALLPPTFAWLDDRLAASAPADPPSAPGAGWASDRGPIGPGRLVPEPLIRLLALGDARGAASQQADAGADHAPVVGAHDGSGLAEDDDPAWGPQRDEAVGLLTTDLQPSPWLELPALAAEPGVTALAGQVLLADGTPLAAVTLEVGGRTARTDDTGRFLLSELAAGHHELAIDGRGANTPGRTYGVFVVGVDLVAGETSALPYTVWMPRLDTAHYVTIPSPTTEDVVLTTPRIPGLEIHLPAGSVVRDRDGQPVTELGITPFRLSRPPFAPPEGQHLQFGFTVQPGGATIEPYGMRVVYPNRRGLPAGSRLDFGHYDPAGEGWYVYGRGTVSDDATRVVPDPSTAFHRLTGFSAPLPGPYFPARVPFSPGAPTCCDPVELNSGQQVFRATDLSVPDIMAIQLERILPPNDDPTIPRPFGKGGAHSYDMFLWVGTGCSPVCVVLADGTRIPLTGVQTSCFGAPALCTYEVQGTFTQWHKAFLSFDRGEKRWKLRLRNGTTYLFGDGAPLQAIRDRNGNQVTIYREGTEYPTSPGGGFRGRVSHVVSPNGRWIAFTYAAGTPPSMSADRILAARDNLGRTVQYTYCGTGEACDGYLKEVTDPDGLKRKYTYEAHPTLTGTYRLKTLKDGQDQTVLTNTYDATSHQLTGQALAASGVSYGLSYSGSTVTVTQPGNKTRQTVLNGSGYPQTETRDPGGAAQATTYTREGTTQRVTRAEDWLGRKTDYGYDALGNVASVTRLATTSQAVTSAFVYEPAYSQLVRATDAAGRVTTLEYDARGNVTAINNPAGERTVFTYNTAGQPVTVSDPLGRTTTMTYERGTLVATTDPTGRTTRRFVDGGGRLVAATNAAGATRQSTYDVMNRRTAATNALGQTTQWAHDANGNLTGVTDALNHTTTLGYDPMNRRTSRTDPLNEAETFAYNADSTLQQATDRRGQSRSYTYDPLGRPATATFGTQSALTYTYDTSNRLTQIDDTAGSTTTTLTRGFDDLNRLLMETTPQGTVGYGYDATGRRTSLSVTGASDLSTSYQYDAAGRFSGETRGTAAASIARDAAGRRSTLTLPDGIVQRYAYEASGRLSGVSYERGTTILGDLTYQYDAAGRPTGHGGSYARLVLPPAVTGTTYDAANRLLTRTTGSGTTTLTRDDNGNVTGDGTNSYTWNARNRLVGISGGTSASFGYDALGRRASRTVGTTTTEFLYSGRSILREQVGSTYATLLTSPGGERYTRTSGSVRRTLLTAPDGDTIALADDAGTVQTEYSYGPQCETTASGASDSNPYKCLGTQDDGTGLLFDGDDYFNPSLGSGFGGSLGRGSRGGADYTSRMRSVFDFSGILAQQTGVGVEYWPGISRGGGGYLGGGGGVGPTVSPELLQALATAIAAGAVTQAEALYETIRDILMPDGQPIGRRGSNDRTREMPNEEVGAEELLERLREFMTPRELPGNYPEDGEAYTTENGGFIGHRPHSESKDHAIDVHDNTVPEVGKIHFPPGYTDDEGGGAEDGD